jgi:hypothetical protein
MATIGELIRSAVGSCASRGDVYWIANMVWKLGIFEKSQATHHPGLVLTKLPDFAYQLAPGTSKPIRDKRLKPFALRHPQALNGNSSTFFLSQPIPISERSFGAHLGRIHPADLTRLDAILPERGAGK